jgi:hypothetical protein
MTKINLKKFLAALSLVAFVAGCSPEVGSKEWCADLKAKDKGQWTADDAGSFAKHCIM